MHNRAWVWLCCIWLASPWAGGVETGVLDKCFPDIRFGEHDDVYWELDADTMVQRTEDEFLEFDENGGARSFSHTHEETRFAPVYTQELPKPLGSSSSSLWTPSRISFWIRMSVNTSQLHVSFLEAGLSVITIKALGRSLFVNEHIVSSNVVADSWTLISFYLTGWKQPRGLTISMPISDVQVITLIGIYSGINAVSTWGGGNPTWVDRLSFDCVHIPPNVYFWRQDNKALSVKLEGKAGNFVVFGGDELFFSSTPDCTTPISDTRVTVRESTTEVFDVKFPVGHPSRGQIYYLCYNTKEQGFLRTRANGWALSYNTILSTPDDPNEPGCSLEPNVGQFKNASLDCGQGVTIFECVNGKWVPDPYTTCAAGVFDLPHVVGAQLVDGSCTWQQERGLLTQCQWEPLPGTAYHCDSTKASWDVTNRQFLGSVPKCVRGCFAVDGAFTQNSDVTFTARHNSYVTWNRKEGYTCSEIWTKELVDSRNLDNWEAKCYHGVWRRDAVEDDVVECHRKCVVTGHATEGAEIIDTLHTHVMHLETVRWGIKNGYVCDTVLTSCKNGVLGEPVCKLQACTGVEGMSYTCQQHETLACRYHALPNSMCAKWMGYQLGSCYNPNVDCTKSPTCSVPTSPPEGAWSPCLLQSIIQSSTACAWRTEEGYYCNTQVTTCGDTGYLTFPECLFKCNTRILGTETNCSDIVPKGATCSFSAEDGWACTTGTFTCTNQSWPVHCTAIEQPSPTTRMEGTAMQFSMEVVITMRNGLNDNEKVTSDIAYHVRRTVSEAVDASTHIFPKTVEVIKICGIDDFHAVNSFTCVYPVEKNPDDLPPVYPDSKSVSYYLEFRLRALDSSIAARVELFVASHLSPSTQVTPHCTVGIAPRIKQSTVVFTPRPAWAAASTAAPLHALLVFLLFALLG
eukprot:TRINITY_DN20124_c0_g1_i1.p1 TRINITY_DN20124_c0_g1~~TRINITY_DN20124_c0_g1_i1.p1  ORF type:complete len:911 (+),score=110.54 TRINITY_DN20124_c0_g1_i1:791-3523(+)